MHCFFGFVFILCKFCWFFYRSKKEPSNDAIFALVEGNQQEEIYKPNIPAWQQGTCTPRKISTNFHSATAVTNQSLAQVSHDPRWGVLENKELNSLLQENF